MIKTFVMMGLPGSGKGKQAQLLSERTGYRVFSTGSKLRQMAMENTFVGKKISKDLDSGGLVPDWLAEYLSHNTLLHLEGDEGVILDGVNRYETESREFSEICKWLERDFRIINIRISESTITERLHKRQKIEGRKDDDNSVLDNRLTNFHTYTAPAIEYFRSIDKVIDIDGEPLPEKVFEEIWEKVSIL